MAYIFPINPVDGQLYPSPAIAGSLQYIWVEGQNAWLIYSPLGVQSVSGNLPIVVTNNTSNPVVSILPATVSTPGTLSPDDKQKIDNLPTSFGTVTRVAAGTGLTTSLPSNAPITATGTINLLPPLGAAIGGVKAGSNVTIDTDGTISSAGGTVTSINCVDGIIAAPNPITNVGTITLRPASNLLIGGVIVGTGINVDSSGLISLAGGLGSTEVAAWATVSVSNTSPPVFTLLEGYNISSISYLGGTNPSVRITYQRPFANGTYAVITNGRVYDYGVPNKQSSAVLNTFNKSSTYTDLVLQMVNTLNQSVSGGTIDWNQYINLNQFDLIVADTRTS